MAKYTSPAWTDDMLLDLIRLKDDDEAFAELYDRYWDVLVDTAYKRLKSRDLAHEVVQDIFVSFFVRRRKIVLKSTLEAYLKTAVRNQVFRAFHTQQKHLLGLSDLKDLGWTGPDLPDELLEAKQLRHDLLLATEQLPDKCRQVFVMSRYEQLSNTDIAGKLEISVSTVKKHITKALALLRSATGSTLFDCILFLFLQHSSAFLISS